MTYESQRDRIERMKQSLVPLVTYAQVSENVDVVVQLLSQMAAQKASTAAYVAFVRACLEHHPLTESERTICLEDLRSAEELIEVISAYQLRLTTHRILH